MTLSGLNRLPRTAVAPGSGRRCARAAGAAILSMTVLVPGAELAARLQWYAMEPRWVEKMQLPPLTRKQLTAAIEAARVYMLNHQRPAGNFVYEYDMVLNTIPDDDNPVRQAGALWSLASLYRERPTPDTRKTVIRGLDFFFRITRPLSCGQVGPVYPGEEAIRTGTVALLCLALVDFCRAEEQYGPRAGGGLYQAWLSKYLDYLQAMELSGGGWSREYYPELNESDPEPSGYYDGEALLAYSRAARYLGHTELVPKVERLAPILAARYTVDVWETSLASNKTGAFFQWGCMAFAEYTEAGWKDANLLADATMALAWWAVYARRVQHRTGNTAYAVEGLLAACRVATNRGERQAAERLATVARTMLTRLISWQAGGPLQKHNDFLQRRKDMLRAVGGVMSGADSGVIRIDVVQHQLHAMLMALELLFPE